MNHCEVSKTEYEELVQRFERLLKATGFEEVTCPNMTLGAGEIWKPWCAYSCELCRGVGTVLVKKV